MVSSLISGQMKNKLKEKQAAITSLEKKFEEELIYEKEVQYKVLGKVKAEQQSLVKKLEVATVTIARLGQELRKEQKLVEELTINVDNLEQHFQNAGDEKRQLQQQLKEKLDSVGVLQEKIDLLSLEIKDKEYTIWHLSAKLADKERELNQLSSVYQQSQDWLTSLQSESTHLRDTLLKNEEELRLKNEMVHELDSELASSLAEVDESNKKLDAILKEYNNFKSSMEEKSASDEKVLGERYGKIHLLEEQLEISLDDKKKDRVLISALTLERDDLKEMLKKQLKNMKDLGEELRITQVALEESRYETSDLTKQLQESRRLCSELEDEVSKVQAEFSEARESFQMHLDEVKRGAEILAGEVSSSKELLSKSNEELQIMSSESAAALQKCNSLEEELIDAVRKAESAAVDLNEEKMIISSLNKELMDLETQILKDKEERKGLESDLEEATNYLDEMNENATMLSRELKLAHSQISSLEDEKDKLYTCYKVQNQGYQEARVNLDDAHNLIMRLGKEREGLIKRVKKREGELAAAKGEILRLMSRMKSPATAVEMMVDEEGKAADSSTRNVKRGRKAKPQQQDS